MQAIMSVKEIKAQPGHELLNSRNKTTVKNDILKRQYSAYDAPSLKEFLWVLAVFALLIALSWVAYHRFGWLH